MDWHGMYPAAAQTDPVGPASGSARVIRGGGLDYKAAPKTDGGKHLPAEMRYYALSEPCRHGSGFRGGAWDRLRVVQAEMPGTKPWAVETQR